MRSVCVRVVMLGLCLYSVGARADIYSFVDEQGVTHYTNMPDDTRYALLIKSPPEPKSIDERFPDSVHPAYRAQRTEGGAGREG